MNDMPTQSGPATLADLTGSISKSRMGTWMACPYRFFRRYVLGEIKPPTAAMAFGTSFDKTANQYYGEKAKTAADMTAENTVGLWRAEFAREAERVQDWPEEETETTLVDQGARLAEVWREERAVTTQPIATQQSFRVDVPVKDGEVPWALTGIVDLIARDPAGGEPIGIDTKTSGRKWSPAQALSALDAPAYAVGVAHCLGGTGERFAFHVAVRKKEPETQLIERAVSEAERRGFVRRALLTKLAIADAYRSGTFLPNRQHVTCSRRWCGYWRECEAEFGGRIPE